jgi:hypothetical protein
MPKNRWQHSNPPVPGILGKSKLAYCVSRIRKGGFFPDTNNCRFSPVPIHSMNN